MGYSLLVICDFVTAEESSGCLSPRSLLSCLGLFQPVGCCEKRVEAFKAGLTGFEAVALRTSTSLAFLLLIGYICGGELFNCNYFSLSFYNKFDTPIVT